LPTLKLTQAAVDRLKPPAEGRVEYWDSQLPGFGVRVAAPRTGRQGRKTWQVMYRVNGKLVRETLGTLASIPKIDHARDLARVSMQQAQAGIHPAEERKRFAEEAGRRMEAELSRHRDTVAAVIDRYLDRYAAKRMRLDYFKETGRTLNRDVKPAFGSKPIRDVKRRDVRELLEQIVDRGSPSHANHVLAYLRAMMNWAVGNDLIEANPCSGLKMPAPLKERDRVLSDDEVRLFWFGCDEIGWPFGPLFKLPLLTAQRRDELAEARWSELDVDKALWSLPRERTKNDKAHPVHLSSLALDIITRLPIIGNKGFLFTTTGVTPVSGFGRARERLANAMLALETASSRTALEPFTLHDLRRTAATGMAGIGISHHVVDRVLNHVGGKITGIARIYNRAEYLDERKAALNAWSRYVENLVCAPIIRKVVEFGCTR
jgi:integrase